MRKRVTALLTIVKPAPPLNVPVAAGLVPALVSHHAGLLADVTSPLLGMLAPICLGGAGEDAH